MLNDKRPGIGVNRARASFLVNFTGLTGAVCAHIRGPLHSRRIRPVSAEAPAQSNAPSFFLSLRSRRYDLGDVRSAWRPLTGPNDGRIHVLAGVRPDMDQSASPAPAVACPRRWSGWTTWTTARTSGWATTSPTSTCHTCGPPIPTCGCCICPRWTPSGSNPWPFPAIPITTW